MNNITVKEIKSNGDIRTIVSFMSLCSAAEWIAYSRYASGDKYTYSIAF